ncbi:MAG: DUF2185 domain-containing protein [Cocleimonas sp.]|nr:DUF2185 domain-containing protein [Cocleimonas sp.]
MSKKFKLKAEDIKDLAKNRGGCIATDEILVKGRKVGYMYRDEPHNEMDSGWCFLAGDESDEYMDTTENHGVYDVNTIANYDPDIIKFLDYPEGSYFLRDEIGELVEMKD